MTPIQRLVRMKESFETSKSVSFEDYKYFTTPDGLATRRVSTPRNKAARTSEERSGRQSREQSETPSSDRTDD
jgi:hypothetical protein